MKFVQEENLNSFGSVILKKEGLNMWLVNNTNRIYDTVAYRVDALYSIIKDKTLPPLLPI